jgi:endonuclease III
MKARVAPAPPVPDRVRRMTTQPPHVYDVAETLKARYRDFAHYNRRNPLDELLFIMCSVQTDERKYRAAHRQLRRRFPRFAMLAEASVDDVAETINGGGLANQRARAITEIMASVVERFGRPSLADLKSLPDAECEALLTSLPRVGKKTARCVMLYSLGRDVFPVDIHCWRVATRLGWFRPTRPYNGCSKTYRARLEDELQDMIPADLRFSLHVNFVSLGREHCAPRNPNCGSCPIRRYCKRIGVSTAGSRAVPAAA